MTDSSASAPDAAPDAAGGAAPDPAGELAALFERAGVPAALTGRTLARLGPGAAARLRDDPWKLLRVPGVAADQADHFARGLLGDAASPADPRRGRALAEHLLSAAARQGHTVTPLGDVLEALERRTRTPDPRKAVEGALDEGEVLLLLEEPEFDEDSFDEDADPPEPAESLGLARWAMAEETAAEGFQRLTLTAAPLRDDAAVRELRDGLPEDRSLALTAALRTGVTLLRGAPGDVAATVALIAGRAAGAGLRVAVAAPTDEAAAEFGAEGAHPAGGAPAAAQVKGLHALLEPLPETSPAGGVAFARGEQAPLEADLLLLPDASGLDVELAAVLVEACADGTHLVLGTAPGAPPSAGPGAVLADLEASETVPVVELDPREGEGPLAELIAAVRGGELAAVKAPNKEVVIVPAAGLAEAVHRALQLVTDSIPRVLGVPAEQVRVVSLAAAGEAGAGALNTALKERLNPGPGRFGGFDEGDRVVVAAPLPQAAIGESGTVTGADATGLHVRFAGGDAVVPPAATSRLRHGWALPVWLARGTPRDALVVVVPADAPLSRPAVATAFGLARTHLSIVQAAGPALARAVRETAAPQRRTRLARLVLG
ncbi:helix-hairpin-helix domain-containing protein [Actinomadura parmotrematis]|uniref:Conjugal transfer protein TraA n=1 Tax=Actinomadura parmotrematis TaxID=2864039 RepID=A0ABS7FSI5_9ACTN|nr:helix-hairpin-helix domain-containing protein [Actinomadura parmotrematis]MBW8483366.1 conjugal transfer protein TraA [Actinomadura parmotrematis]